MPFLQARNDAVNKHPAPPTIDYPLTTRGSSWLYSVCSIYGAATLITIALSYIAKQNERIFHRIFTIAYLVGTVAYFAMGSNVGYLDALQPHQVDDNGDNRQMFWVKYVLWAVDFPLVSTALGIASGISWAEILYNVALAWTWIICYLIGTVIGDEYRWALYALGTLAWLLLAENTLVRGTQAAGRVGIKGDYLILAGWANLMWFLYALGYGLTDAGNVIRVTPSFIWFGITDLLLMLGVGFGIIVVFAPRWDYGKLNLFFTQYGRVAVQEGNFPEKDTANNGTQQAAAPAV
ncbi:uncharacterized protein CTHT_0013550 [Thermochaetoides thermophila DSM 1495]|uniref:Uncharacterized protein n=1 Tax=Chaetomium thermophilum (strain DSM 1495 / CBS 144.50 / IMI 039719) TaxID=759272 RepID=G0S1G8_CHATD|nr:hypothetical protein CTHT_0013550 [Thermochaetoides thermophila DSM 1495]EGS22878.1 hypothetical protein CTHT_0013550 [Thermochaetoides thermophila DSM 1495]